MNNTHAGTQVFLRIFIIYQDPFGHNAHNHLTVEASDGCLFSKHTQHIPSSRERERERHTQSSVSTRAQTHLQILHNHRKRVRLIRPSPTVRLSDREECAQHTHTHTPDNTQRQKYQPISKLSSGIDFTHWSQSARSILQCIGSEPTIKGTNCYFRSGLL